jgi:hypothetical protein
MAVIVIREVARVAPDVAAAHPGDVCVVDLGAMRATGGAVDDLVARIAADVARVQEANWDAAPPITAGPWGSTPMPARRVLIPWPVVFVVDSGRAVPQAARAVLAANRVRFTPIPVGDGDDWPETFATALRAVLARPRSRALARAAS